MVGARSRRHHRAFNAQIAIHPSRMNTAPAKQMSLTGAMAPSRREVPPDGIDLIAQTKFAVSAKHPRQRQQANHRSQAPASMAKDRVADNGDRDDEDRPKHSRHIQRIGQFRNLGGV